MLNSVTHLACLPGISRKRTTGRTVLALSLLFSACVSTARPEPVTQDQVITLFEQGAAPEVVLTRMRAAGMVYALKARDVVELIERGVPESVVDYMLETRRQDTWNGRRPGPAFYYGPVYRGFYGTPYSLYPFCY